MHNHQRVSSGETEGRKDATVRNTKQTLQLHKALCNTAHSYIFENALLPTTAVQQRQYVDRVRCRKLFSGLIIMFVFDILEIPSGCTQI
jgi:hypothetical protein